MHIDGTAAHGQPVWTHGVQIEVADSSGEPVLQEWLVRQLLAELAGLPGRAREIEIEPVMDTPDGVWLASVPADMYADASEQGGLRVTHSAGYVIDIPMP